MFKKSLNKPALKIINNFLHLYFNDKLIIKTPYYNNRHQFKRAGLRVYIGKGSSDELIEETTLLLLKNKIDETKLKPEQLREFMKKHNLGLDCSAYAYYIFQAQSLGLITKKLKYPFVKNWFKKLIIKFRRIENADVKTFNHDYNSRPLKLSEIKPGDFLSIIGHGRQKNENHIIIIYQVDYNEDNSPQTIYYTHSFNWPNDKNYIDGVNTGKIIITNPNKSLLLQKWQENDKTNKYNYTFQIANNCQQFSLRRLVFLDK